MANGLLESWLSIRHYVLTGQLALQQLSSRTFGDLCYKSNRLRAFVVRKLLAAKSDDILFRRLPALFEHDKCSHFLTIKFIGHSDSRGRSYRGMLIEHLVDLAWIDIFSASNNHIALAVNYIKEPVSVAVADVAGMKPAVAKRSRSCLGITVVTFQNVLAAQDYFTEFSICHFLIVVVDHLHFIADWHSTRTGPASGIGRVESRTTG